MVLQSTSIKVIKRGQRSTERDTKGRRCMGYTTLYSKPKYTIRPKDIVQKMNVHGNSPHLWTPVPSGHHVLRQRVRRVLQGSSQTKVQNCEVALIGECEVGGLQIAMDHLKNEVDWNEIRIRLSPLLYSSQCTSLTFCIRFQFKSITFRSSMIQMQMMKNKKKSPK